MILKIHKISFCLTHNLEVLGSSPSWSTLIIKHLRVSRKCFFFCRRPSSDLFEAKVTSRDLLKLREIFYEFKKCFRKDDGENKECHLKVASRRSKPDTRFRYVVLSCPPPTIKKTIFGGYMNSKNT